MDPNLVGNSMIDRNSKLHIVNKLILATLAMPTSRAGFLRIDFSLL